MEDATGVKVVRAHVPLSEMFGYVGDLRSKTSGRAVYSMQFDSYSEVPKAVGREIVQKSKGELLATLRRPPLRRETKPKSQ
jgi:elongation factor G